ncbi:MAG TPA: hypothetical protein VGD67_16480, partial [Pseudonocardiaceae bacterium]
RDLQRGRAATGITGATTNAAPGVAAPSAGPPPTAGAARLSPGTEAIDFTPLTRRATGGR